jgi:hypothetical protein
MKQRDAPRRTTSRRPGRGRNPDQSQRPAERGPTLAARAAPALRERNRPRRPDPGAALLLEAHCGRDPPLREAASHLVDLTVEPLRHAKPVADVSRRTGGRDRVADARMASAPKFPSRSGPSVDRRGRPRTVACRWPRCGPPPRREPAWRAEGTRTDRAVAAASRAYTRQKRRRRLQTRGFRHWRQTALASRGAHRTPCELIV